MSALVIGVIVAIVLLVVIGVVLYATSSPFTAEDEGKIYRCEVDGGIYKIEGGKARWFPDPAIFMKHVPSGAATNDKRMCGNNFPKGEPMK